MFLYSIKEIAVLNFIVAGYIVHDMKRMPCRGIRFDNF
jgi:hypothetical protein